MPLSSFAALGTTAADFTYLSSKNGRVTAYLSNCASAGVAYPASHGYWFNQCDDPNQQLTGSNYDNSAHAYSNYISFQVGQLMGIDEYVLFVSVSSRVPDDLKVSYLCFGLTEMSVTFFSNRKYPF